MDKVIVTVDQHGNTSAASIPLALDMRCARQHQAGDTVLLEGVGGGFTWGAVLLDLLSASRHTTRHQEETER
jgi:3-oxoacyl-[acyl-carrier-protein] synthase-3